MTQGLNRVFATAYQSCRVLDLPEIDKTTPDAIGIKRIGTRPDGGGVRIIDNFALVQKTHYYVKNVATQSSCINVQNNPPIYDFGGKAGNTKGRLDLFKNNSDGSQALGIDCSGYISAAIAAAGLKLSIQTENKLIYAVIGARS